MKKILALTIVLVLVLGLALVSCEKAVDDNALAALESAKASLSDQLSGVTGNSYGDFNANGDKKIELLNDMTPVEKYDEAFEEINSLPNFTLTSYQDIKMVLSYNGETVEEDMIQEITQKYDGENFSVVGNAESAGQRIPSTNCQYVDGIVYNVQVTDGMKIKYQATKADLERSAGIDPDEDKIFDIPESWFKNVSFYEEKNGNRAYIEIILSGEQYMQMFSNFSLLSSVRNITDVTHRVYFTESGDLDSIVTTATLTMKINGIDATASFVSTTTLSNVGTTLVFAPVNAYEYTLVDISMLV